MAAAFWVPRRADGANLSEGGCPARNRAAGEHDEAFARHQLAHQSARLMNRDAPVDASGDVRGDVPAATDELAIFLVCLCASSSACAEPQRGRNWCKTRILYVI